MQVLEQRYILLSTLFWSFAITLKQNKIHCTNQENAICIFFGGGGVEFGLTVLSFSGLGTKALTKNRQSITACGYCFEHCSKTNHIAIKRVIKQAKYENVFGLTAY